MKKTTIYHFKEKEMEYANMELTDSTSTYTPPNKRCELCYHYGFFDSGYGYCKRYPPQLIRVKWIPPRYDHKYPLVAWCENACGEYYKK